MDRKVDPRKKLSVA